MSLTHVRRSSSVVIFLVATTAAVWGQEWADSIAPECFGDVNVANSLSAWWSNRLQFRSGSNASSFYLLLAPADFASDRLDKQITVDSVILDEAKKVALKNNIVILSNDYKVPTFAEEFADIYMGIQIANPVVGAASGRLKDYLVDKINEASINLKQLSLFIARGGEVTRTLVTKYSANGAAFAIVTSNYEIKIGYEKRHMVVYSCTYPVVLQVKEFITKGPFNNKIVKPKVDNSWGVYDVESNRWDNTTLRYIGQVPGFAIFEEDEVEIGGISKHMISINGGPWLVKRPDDLEFSGRYANVEAR